MRGRWLRREAAWLVAAVWLAVLLRATVVDIGRLEGVSMEPTLFPEDQLIVIDRLSLLLRKPRRFEAIVHRTERDGRLAVKRAAGFPGEYIRIEGGDFLAGTTPDRLEPPRRSEAVQRGMLVPLHGPADSFAAGFRAEGGKAAESAGGVDLLPDAGGATFAFVGDPARRDGVVRDSFRDPAGQVSAGQLVVRDVRIAFVLGHLAAGAVLRVEHELDGETLSLRIEGREGGAEIRLHGAGEDAAGPVSVALPATVDLSSIDGAVKVAGGSLYDSPRTLLAGRRDRPRVPSISAISIAISGGEARLSSLVVERDVHYTPAPEGMTPRDRVRVPGNAWFVLGDGTTRSLDSRVDEPVDGGAIAGRLAAVCWPPRRWRMVR